MVVHAEFEREFSRFLEQQKIMANARRAEMLEKDLTGTKKMMLELLWPVFRNFEGFELEHELKGANGVSIFIDAFYAPLRLAFECEGFTSHAETIPRRRFNFEKHRVRLMLRQDIYYVPFTWDYLDDSSRTNITDLKELIAKRSSRLLLSSTLSVYEREVIRAFGASQQPFNTSNVCQLLDKKTTFCQKVIKSLIEKKLVKPYRSGLERNHVYVVEVGALQFLS
ncbi:hypothetical protein [Paenibacillus soyae]|uniref:Uncharacterized protein n=1 Tax=Paenibacillus soyae TaxID=2969249 RepID=A0A9X2MT76_9BACL|nr:hypothetical protein [Paenibacillus soyae]MCR2806531.1 hypothetical protein [Paenibacillus soyae]